MNKMLITILMPLAFSFAQAAQNLTPQISEHTDAPCAICLENMLPAHTISILQCDHTFHTDCVKTWLTNKSNCPICRAKIKVDNLQINNVTTDIIIENETITIWADMLYTLDEQFHYFHASIKEKITKGVANILLQKLDLLHESLLNPNTFSPDVESNQALATIMTNSMRQKINQLSNRIETTADFISTKKMMRKITLSSFGILIASISLLLLENNMSTEDYYNWLSNYTMY